jgi:hypothetical protein
LLAIVIVAGVATQFFLAAAGAFGATSYTPHRALGWALAGAAVVAFLLSLVARRLVRASALLIAAVAVQVVLGSLGTSTSPWFGALHGLNALVVGATAGNLLRATLSRPGPAESGPATT